MIADRLKIKLKQRCRMKGYEVRRGGGEGRKMEMTASQSISSVTLLDG